MQKLQSKDNNKLDAEDLRNMATVAFNDKWYDTTIKFLKVSILPYQPVFLAAVPKARSILQL